MHPGHVTADQLRRILNRAREQFGKTSGIVRDLELLMFERERRAARPDVDTDAHPIRVARIAIARRRP